VNEGKSCLEEGILQAIGALGTLLSEKKLAAEKR
jgi:hypothetical protein